jgi:hypothetical protein
MEKSGNRRKGNGLDPAACPGWDRASIGTIRQRESGKTLTCLAVKLAVSFSDETGANTFGNFMKIEFVEDIDLALRKSLRGRVTKHRRFESGEVQYAEFLGEDSDLETIDLRFENGLFAIKVPRFAVCVSSQICPADAGTSLAFH